VISLRHAAPVLAGVLAEGSAHAATSGEGGVALPWIVLGSIGAIVAAIVLRMVIAARFPKGYGEWARRRRDSFAKQNDTWDRADDEFRQ